MDFFQHAFQRVEHLVVPESENEYVLGKKNLGAFIVVKTLFVVVMSASVKLNRKSGFMAIEIEDIARNWILATELEAVQPASPQEVPKQGFRVSLLLAKVSGEREQFRRNRQCCLLILGRQDLGASPRHRKP